MTVLLLQEYLRGAALISSSAESQESVFLRDGSATTTRTARTERTNTTIAVSRLILCNVNIRRTFLIIVFVIFASNQLNTPIIQE